MRRALFIGAALLLLVGAAEPSPVRPTGDAGLEQAFDGLAIGRGRFRSRLIGLDRGFLVWTSGRRSGDTFILDQIFRFDDGELDHRTWRFERSGPGLYVGTRQDVAGTALARIDGETIRLSYDIDWKRRGGRPLRLHFEDRITRLASGALYDRAVIYRLGIPVGSVETSLIPGAGRAVTSGRQPSVR